MLMQKSFGRTLSLRNNPKNAYIENNNGNYYRDMAQLLCIKLSMGKTASAGRFREKG